MVWKKLYLIILIYKLTRSFDDNNQLWYQYDIKIVNLPRKKMLLCINMEKSFIQVH